MRKEGGMKHIEAAIKKLGMCSIWSLYPFISPR